MLQSLAVSLGDCSVYELGWEECIALNSLVMMELAVLLGTHSPLMGLTALMVHVSSNHADMLVATYILATYA